MKYTSHGHAIPGTENIQEEEPQTRARCGGVSSHNILGCRECTVEAVEFFAHNKSAEVVPAVVFHQYVDEIPSGFVPYTHMMDPSCEDVIWGDQLQKGMVVLLQENLFREDPRKLDELEEGTRDYEYLVSRLKRSNQYFRIVDIRRRSGQIVEMIGVDPDGVKHKHMYNESYTWIVRLK